MSADVVQVNDCQVYVHRSPTKWQAKVVSDGRVVKNLTALSRATLMRRVRRLFAAPEVAPVLAVCKCPECKQTHERELIELDEYPQRDGVPLVFCENCVSTYYEDLRVLRSTRHARRKRQEGA